MSVKKLFVLLLFVVFCSRASAQLIFHPGQQDLRLDKISDDRMEMKTDIRTVFVDTSFKSRQFANEKPENGDEQPTVPGQGFGGSITLGYQLGVGDYGVSRVKLDLSAGYRIDPHISLGAGIGARQYPDFKATLLPVYVDFRGWLLTTRVSPFFSFQVGTMFHMSKDFENVGIFVSPNLGVSSRFSDGTSMHFSIGYEYQRMDFYRQAYGYAEQFNGNCGAVSINIGVAF